MIIRKSFERITVMSILVDIVKLDSKVLIHIASNSAARNIYFMKYVKAKATFLCKR